MKRESPWGVLGLVAFAIVCCFGPILALSLGAGALAALMGYWHYVLIGVLLMVGGLIIYIIFKAKMSRKRY